MGWTNELSEYIIRNSLNVDMYETLVRFFISLFIPLS